MSGVEGFIELSALEFETDAVIPELVLLVSLMLRDPQTFILTLGAGSAEYKSSMRQQRNVWLEPLIPNLLRGRRELFYSPFVPQNALLPDTCFSCLTSFGLTIAGRLRTVCPHCTENRTKEYIEFMGEVGVFWVPHILFETLTSQLIYKYYSPNGDRSWQLNLPSLTS